jgi:GNAT superfamily N-acetyltransferase
VVARIRLARHDDGPRLAALRRSWVEENAGGPVDDDAYDDAYDDAFADWFAREHQHRVTWLAEVGDRPVGMLNLTVFTRMPRPGRAPSRWGYLGNFFVLAGHRGSGIGTRLLDACTTYADTEGFVRIVLSPSERSVPLYARAGFGPAGELLLRQGPTAQEESASPGS